MAYMPKRWRRSKPAVGPLVVGRVLVLREPADAAGVGLVVGPGVAAEAGEVLVRGGRGRRCPCRCPHKSRRLHLADAAIGGVGAHGVTGLRRGRVDVDGAEPVDAAHRVDADDAGGLLAQLALDGEAVLNLVGKLGVGRQLGQDGGWAASVRQSVMGTQPEAGSVAGLSERTTERRRAFS